MTTVARRGRESGPTLSTETCKIGARVRITASTGLMAGQVGTIIKGEGTNSPTIRFKSGQEMSFPARKLQLVKAASGPLPLEEIPEYAKGTRIKAHGAVATWTDAEGEEHEHTIKPEDPLVSSKDKPNRDDADWNF